MNKLILGATFAVALIGSILGASAKDQPGQRFITKAIQGNLAEIQMGQLAQQKAGSDAVRSFGQQLVTDHTAANRSATSVASQLGVTPPTEPSKKHKAMYDKMSKLSGDAFDRQFVKHMVADHKEEIAEHQKTAKKANDPAAGYAKEVLPTLQHHLQTAQSLAKSGSKSR